MIRRTSTQRFEPDATRGRRRPLVERWVRRRLGNIAHERRVAEIAMTLLDLTSPLHGLGRSERRLLRVAALVHDVGRSIDADGHEKHGARLLLEDETLPLTPAQRRAVAYLTRYHRGRVPEVGDDEILTPCDDREALRTTLALLRAADALDGRSVQRPRLAFTLRRAGRTPELHVTCCLEHECARARSVYGRRKKFRLLEESLGIRVTVDVRLAEALARVA